MNLRKSSPFLLIVAASLLNIILAYAFGGTGYEAIITISFALGLLITWQSVQLFNFIRHSDNWLILKASYMIALFLFWLIILCGVMFSVSFTSYDLEKVSPDVNWLVVGIGALLYLTAYISNNRIKLSLTALVAGWTVTLYSVMILFMAILVFHDSDSKYGSLSLVLALQLQYLMSYLVVKTSYLESSLKFVKRFTRKLRLSKSEYGEYVSIFFVGLPFIVPFIVLLTISAVK